jgi:hypothetical protein
MTRTMTTAFLLLALGCAFVDGPAREVAVSAESDSPAELEPVEPFLEKIGIPYDRTRGLLR